MTSSSFTGKIKAIVSCIIACIILGFGYAGYQTYNEYYRPSPLEIASRNLGFTIAQTDAIIEMLYVTGRLNPNAIWHDINNIGGIEHPENTFKALRKALEKASAIYDQNGNINNEFDPTIIRHLFGKADGGIDAMTSDDMQDFLLYMSQWAFDRPVGEARDKLNNKSWMIKYENQYLQAARKLGLIDQIIPDMSKTYDYVFVMGASRPTFIKRIHWLNKVIEDGLKASSIYILTGQRELWTEIDAMGKSPEDAVEAMEYIRKLATANNVPYSKEKPFSICGQNIACQLGRVAGRHYLNSTDSLKKVTETMMSQDIVDKLCKNIKANIIDTANNPDGTRPDTYTTAIDAADIVAHKILEANSTIKDKIIEILVISNNPYIDRQVMSAQAAMQVKLSEYGISPNIINFSASGPEAMLYLPNIASESAALIAEAWKKSRNNKNRDPKDLMFQTRQYKDPSHIPQMPK